MRILGIDPGYATIGYGVIDSDSARLIPVGFGAITTPPDLDFPVRLQMIYRDMGCLLAKYRPDAMSLEKLYFKSNKTTAIAVAEARGVIELAAAEASVPISAYTPLQVKQSVVGYGQAEKQQVMEMTRRLLHLEKTPRPDDTADALALAICHAHSAASLLKRYL